MAVKGPLHNAFVFLDTNDNGLYDDGEVHTRTDERGFYGSVKFDARTIGVTTDVRTIDAGSGTVLCGVTLKANLGSSVATPLTTIMIETGLTSDQLKSLLGLDQDVDLNDFNPYETDLPDDGTGDREGVDPGFDDVCHLYQGGRRGRDGR